MRDVEVHVELESVTRNAYAPLMLPTETVRPLHDIWLRPRRVFRDLALRPIGAADYLLGAAQGTAGWLGFSRAQNAGASNGIAEIFGKALVAGSILGVASLFLFAALYPHLAGSAPGAAARRRVLHVMGYSGVPLAASLMVWTFAALLAGRATFEQPPRPDLDGFIVLLLRMQYIACAVLALWSVVIQVMGLSEVLNLSARQAFGRWILGQLIGGIAYLFLVVLLAALFPAALTRFADALAR